MGKARTKADDGCEDGAGAGRAVNEAGRRILDDPDVLARGGNVGVSASARVVFACVLGPDRRDVRAGGARLPGLRGEVVGESTSGEVGADLGRTGRSSDQSSKRTRRERRGEGLSAAANSWGRSNSTV